MGMNSAQNYLCYWASQNGSEKYLGAPAELYEPNFAAQRAMHFPCDNGTYICRIVKYKGRLNKVQLFKSNIEL